MTAQYLLRFDDLCPTMDQARWQRFVPLLRRYEIQPILAVVPDNHDPELCCSGSDPRFWAEMRLWQAAGATIGLHGYRHICAQRGRSLVPLHAVTEFAGAPCELQQQWIQAGLRIFAAQGLTAQIWVAPRHGFDRETLKVLREQGISTLSDGLADRPVVSGSVTWIPQQLWAPLEKPAGLWTICLHPNTATDTSVRQLEAFLDRFADQFTSVDRVLVQWPINPESLADRLIATHRLWQIRLRRWKRRVTRG